MFKRMKYLFIFALLFACEVRAETIDDIIAQDTPPDILADTPGKEAATEEKPRDRQVNVTQFPGEACNRACVAGERRVCYFKFTLEHYQAMGAACGRCSRGVLADCENPQCVLGDGFEKGIMSINRKVPGPDIHVCKDDQVVVDVVNHAHGTAAALHWHGIHMRDTPHMDGVPFVTQCPIPYSTTFRYNFRATESGTQFYHSHAGHHKANGQYGALIVREPAVINDDAYDFDLPEHYILISDWMHSYAEQFVPGLPSAGGINPDSILINGRGTYLNPSTLERTSVPPTRYYVKPGKRYRFRLINSVSHTCPMQLQIEQHNLEIIASDSFNVKATSYDTLINNSGERYDFVLDANHTQGDFWIRVRGVGLCASRPTEAFALLRYISDDDVTETDVQRPIPQMPHYEETFDEGSVINHPNATCFGIDELDCVTELQAVEEDNELRDAIPDHRFFLGFLNHLVPNEELFRTGAYHHFTNVVSNVTLVGAINNISSVFPSYSPLTQPQDIVESDFCNNTNLPQKCEGKRLCPCMHRLQIPLNSVVELVVVDETSAVSRMHHPFHLHGFRLMVTSMGQHPSGVPMTVSLLKQLALEHSETRRSFNLLPPFKDTVSIPSRGFAVMRFRANNPGFWLMHCHYEWHMGNGMSLVLQVGSSADMVAPPSDFPQCGNYAPDVTLPQ